MVDAIKRFVRKPFYVDAVQVTADNIEEISKWCDGEIITPEAPGEIYIKVNVLRAINDRQTKAFVGDWVLRAGAGYKVYTDKAFINGFDEDSGEELPVVDQETYDLILKKNESGGQMYSLTDIQNGFAKLHNQTNAPSVM